MTCLEFKELAQLRALLPEGALSADELEAFDAHLREARVHEGCEVAFGEAREAATLLSMALPAARPPERVWDAIEASLEAEALRALGHGSRLAGWQRAAGALALAASVAGVALLLGYQGGRKASEQARRAADDGVSALREQSIAHERLLAETAQAQLGTQVRRCQADLATAQSQLAAQQQGMALLGQPATQVVALSAAKGLSSSGSVIFNRKSNQALVVAQALTAQPGHDYELWVIRGDQKVPAGLLKIEPQGATLALVEPGLLRGGVDAFAITLEPAGGSQSPRGTLVLSAAVKKI